MKIKVSIIMLSSLLVLSGCDSLEEVRDGKPVRGVTSITSLCLNGVSYYFYHEDYKAALSVTIDKNTLKPKLCE